MLRSVALSPSSSMARAKWHMYEIPVRLIALRLLCLDLTLLPMLAVM